MRCSEFFRVRQHHVADLAFIEVISHTVVSLKEGGAFPLISIIPKNQMLDKNLTNKTLVKILKSLRSKETTFEIRLSPRKNKQ